MRKLRRKIAHYKMQREGIKRINRFYFRLHWREY